MNGTGLNPCRDLLSLPPQKGPKYLPQTMPARHSELLAVIPRSASTRNLLFAWLKKESRFLATLGMTELVACGPAAAPPTAPRPATEPPAAPRARAVLPAVPLVEGPLAPRVVYPQANQLISSRDSTFVIGSVGNGRASATVNGVPVRVW